MKIGILTYHRSHNYGAVLQAVGLRLCLEEMGHEVHYVDYWPEYHRRMYAFFDSKAFARFDFLHKIRFLQLFAGKAPKIALRRRAFNRFIAEHIEPYCTPYGPGEEFDVIVYGSDQIWRKQLAWNGQFNPVYFGFNELKAEGGVAYSPSMGIIDLNDDDYQFLHTVLAEKRFKKISARESDLRDTLLELGFKDVALTADPAFLPGRTRWESKFRSLGERPVRDRYVLYYNLMDYSVNTEMVEELARSRGLRLLFLNAGVKKMFEGRNHISVAGPEEFMALIKHAEYVVTTSYHGLVFSIMFHRPFITGFKDNSGRARTLLDRLNLSGRFVDMSTTLGSVNALPEIDWSDVDARLAAFVGDSKQYLRAALS